MINRAETDTLRIASASYSLPLFANAVLVSSSFADVDTRDYGATFAIALPFGTRRSASAPRRTTAIGRRHRMPARLLPPPEMFGWRVFDSEGELPQRIAEVAFKAQSAGLTPGGGDDQC
jgi:hypothetical protein